MIIIIIIILHAHRFIAGKANAGVNDDKEGNIIITLTEIEYVETSSGLFSCAPSFSSCYAADDEVSKIKLLLLLLLICYWC